MQSGTGCTRKARPCPGANRLAEDTDESPTRVQPRATDYLSAAVEERARGRAAIASGEDLGGVEASRKSAYPRRKRTVTMDVEHEDAGLALRPTKAPVTPVAKADLLPAPKISATQSSLIARLSPRVDAPEPGPSEPAPARALPAPEREEPPRAATAPARTVRSFAAEAESGEPQAWSRAVPARDAPQSAPDPEPAQPRAAQPSPARKVQLEPWGRRTRSVEAPEPVERRHAPREFYVPEWDRYYNPGFLPRARIPEMRIARTGGPAPEDPAWMLVGRPRGMGQVARSRAPYRASLREGARVQSSRPRKEVERFLEHRGPVGGPADLEGPDEVPQEEPPEPGPAPSPAPSPAASPEPQRRAEFERALAELEHSFQSDQPASVHVPARAVIRAAPAPRAADPHPDVEAAASRAMPAPRSTMRPLPRPVARRRGDESSEEDEGEISPGEEEEGTIGKRPPPDHLQEDAAHQTLAHDATGASLCPTCGRRVSASNPVLVCTSCGRVACGSCGKFSAGQPTGNIYQYEYRFNFPLCQPCFERHYTVQKNLARGRAYLASGNLTYAFYHAQTALKSDPESPYAHEAADLIKQVEARRSQIQKADKEWEEARKKLMRDRTSVLK